MAFVSGHLSVPDNSETTIKYVPNVLGTMPITGRQIAADDDPVIHTSIAISKEAQNKIAHQVPVSVIQRINPLL